MSHSRPLPSRHNGRRTIDGVPFDVEIRMEADTTWTLSLIDKDGDCIVWSEQFRTDDDAHAELLRAINEEGIERVLRHPHKMGSADDAL